MDIRLLIFPNNINNHVSFRLNLTRVQNDNFDNVFGYHLFNTYAAVFKLHLKPVLKAQYIQELYEGTVKMGLLRLFL